MLDHEPFGLFRRSFRAHENETAGELFALQSEFDLAGTQLLAGVSLTLDAEVASIPYHHRARAVISSGDNALEILPLWQRLSGRGLGRAIEPAFSPVFLEAGHRIILAELFEQV